MLLPARGLIAMAAISTLWLAGCSAPTADLEELRTGVAAAGEDPTVCPVGLDGAAALADVGVDAEVTTSAVRVDPAGIGASAGTGVECTFEVGGTGEDLDVHLFLSRGPESSAAFALLPAALRESGIGPDEAQSLAVDLDETAAVVVLGDGVALADVPTEEDDAAILVFGAALDDLGRDEVESVARSLVGDLAG